MDAFDRAVAHARARLAQMARVPVAGVVDAAALRRALGGPLPRGGTVDIEVIDLLADAARPGLVASPGPRYFGFVTGGAVPAALAADVLTAAWDQNTAFGVMSPAAAVAEEVALGWIRAVLGIPDGAAMGFTTGAQMANTTCLLVARRHVLGTVGWDDAEHGLAGGPPVRVLVGAAAHVTVHAALRFAGLGRPVVIPADAQGRMLPAALADAIRGEGPLIVCAQAGEVNTGACDPMDEIADICRDAGAWLHVDGAFGLWAAASPTRRHLVAGHERADSWATDAHKWLNVPYDCGVAATMHPRTHRQAMALDAAYLAPGGELRDGSDWVPEASRRARGFIAWAALRSLGSDGVASLVDRCCDLTSRFATTLEADPAVTILNDIVLNQALARFDAGDGRDADAFTDAVIERVQRDGVCWAGGTTWRGERAMRISVSNWSTTADDVDRSAAAILDAVRAVRAGG